MMLYLKLHSQQSVCLKRIHHHLLNIPYAFSVTTLATRNLLLKYFCCLSVVFLSYGLVCEENPGKVLSPIVTSGSSPKFPNAILQSGITNPLIITI